MRKRAFEFAREGRRLQVDACQNEDGPFWEVWEEGEDERGKWSTCLTESGDPFWRLPTEDEVWDLAQNAF